MVERTEAPSWVVDGNYAQMVGDIVLGRADTVVWLDRPRHVVMPRIIRRTLGRLVRRDELWNGNRERLRDMLSPDPERNVLLWSWAHADAYREQYRAAGRTRPTRISSGCISPRRGNSRPGWPGSERASVLESIGQ